ncbi:MAG: GTP pyrophosphokinase [Eubacterium sp.]|nr:GTP pyrophosphokinase [Eubacterium sp.]
MVYTYLTKLAMKVAYKAHNEQKDREGIPYIFHPAHLAEQMDDEDSCVVALLHDVVEDSDMTLDELKALGFTRRQLEAVELLTHERIDPSLPEAERTEIYLDYIREIKKNELARKIKIADLSHNSDRTRIANPSKMDEARFKKYEKALEILRF